MGIRNTVAFTWCTTLTSLVMHWLGIKSLFTHSQLTNWKKIWIIFNCNVLELEWEALSESSGKPRQNIRSLKPAWNSFGHQQSILFTTWLTLSYLAPFRINAVPGPGREQEACVRGCPHRAILGPDRRPLCRYVTSVKKQCQLNVRDTLMLATHRPLHRVPPCGEMQVNKNCQQKGDRPKKAVTMDCCLKNIIV